MDTAVSGTGADGHHRGGLGRQPVEPLAGGHRLAGGRVVPEPAPVAVVVQLLVGDGPLNHQHERFELATVGPEEPFEEVVGAAVGSALEIDERPVHGDFRQARQRTEGDLLDTGLGGGSQRHRIPVATETCVDPENVDQRFFRFDCCFRWHVRSFPGRDQAIPASPEPTPGPLARRCFWVYSGPMALSTPADRLLKPDISVARSDKPGTPKNSESICARVNFVRGAAQEVVPVNFRIHSNQAVIPSPVRALTGKMVAVGFTWRTWAM